MRTLTRLFLPLLLLLLTTTVTLHAAAALSPPPRRQPRPAARLAAPLVAAVVGSPSRLVPFHNTALLSSRRRQEDSGDSLSSAEGGFRPEDSDYQEDLMMKVIVACAPGIVLGIGMLLFMILFICIRGLCGKCGGRKPDRLYTPGQRRFAKVGMIIGASLLLIAFTVGYVGNTRVADGILGFFDDIIDAARLLVEFGVDLNDNLEEMGEDRDTDLQGSLDASLEEAETLKEGAVVDILDYRTNALHVAFIVPFVGSLFCILAIVTKLAVLCWFFIVLGSLGVLINAIAFTIHYVLDIVLGDICIDLDTYLDDIEQGNLPSDSSLAEYIPCLGADESQNAQDSAIDGFSRAINNLNDLLLIGGDFIEPVPYNAETEANLRDTGDVLFDQIEETTAELDRVTREIEALPEERQAFYEEALEQIRLARAGLQALTSLDEIKSCRLLGNVLETALKPNLCSTVLGGVRLMLAGHAMIGLCTLPAMFFAVRGLKRFSKAPPAPKQAFAAGTEMAAAGTAAAGAAYMQQQQQQQQQYGAPYDPNTVAPAGQGYDSTPGQPDDASAASASTPDLKSAPSAPGTVDNGGPQQPVQYGDPMPPLRR